jgi:peroxiredoxin
MSTVTAILLALGILFAVGTAAAAAEPAAPGFRVKLLDSRTTFDSREEIGKRIVVVRFQASYCRPCGRESAPLSRLADRYRSRGVEFIALHVQDTAADTRRFIRTHRVGYRVALDPKLTIGNSFGFKGAPYTVVISRKGGVAARIEGQSAVTRLPRILDDLLAQKSDAPK